MIYIICKKGKLTFPVTPEVIGPEGGDALYDDVEVLKQGTIPFFKGTSLKTYSWSSHFPLKPTSYTEPTAINVLTGTLNPPKEIAQLLATLRDTAEVITLYITELNIEQKVQIRSFTPRQVKPGDIDYSITMVEYREVKLAIKPQQQTGANNTAQAVKKVAKAAKAAKSNQGRSPAKKPAKKSPPPPSKKTPKKTPYKKTTKANKPYTPKRPAPPPPPNLPKYIPGGRSRED